MLLGDSHETRKAKPAVTRRGDLGDSEGHRTMVSGTVLEVRTWSWGASVAEEEEEAKAGQEEDARGVWSVGSVDAFKRRVAAE